MKICLFFTAIQCTQNVYNKNAKLNYFNIFIRPGGLVNSTKFKTKLNKPNPA